MGQKLWFTALLGQVHSSGSTMLQILVLTEWLRKKDIEELNPKISVEAIKFNWKWVI